MNQAFLTYLWRTMRIVIIVMVCVLILRTFVVEPGRVNGRSMEMTFLDSQFFLLDKYTLLLREPKRREIIQFYDDRDDSLAVKRVIGLPGERVTIRNNKVIITLENGNFFPLNEDYLDRGTTTNGFPDKWTTYQVIPPNHYFVMGDNREESIDSRHFGVVHRKDIRGLVIR